MTAPETSELRLAPRVAITSLGCKVNYAEMAELAGTLAAAGWDVVPESDTADVRVVNSCTVTQQADATTRQRLRRLHRADPGARIVLTGCSVDANPGVYDSARAAHDLGVDAVYANCDKASIASDLLALAAPVRSDAATGAATAAADASLRSRAFVKVQDGCNHRCTYCIVWQARGVSQSRPAGAVIDAVTRAVDSGHAEVVLCGVDLGSYGRDLDTTLATLLRDLLEHVGERARVRLSSINANDVTPELIELNAHPRLCSHWHMPLQSGSDAMLKAMHRGYRRAQYRRVVAALRERDPLTELTTDVMVAFPGEGEADHAETLSLIDEVGFHSCHVFRWSPRPGTPATSHAGRVDPATARRRSAEVRRAAARSGDASRRRAVGREHEVVWQNAATDDEPSRGLSSTYHEILVRGIAPRPGSLGRVRAERISGDVLEGVLVAS
jgi:threonylcarbamoyladenosine tRNA methylthiotransferase MtaB